MSKSFELNLYLVTDVAPKCRCRFWKSSCKQLLTALLDELDRL